MLKIGETYKYAKISMRRYIDEYFDSNSRLIYDFSYIKEIINELFNNGYKPIEIVKELQDKLYIFDDKEETEYELKVVKQILSDKTIYNRFTNEQYK